MWLKSEFSIKENLPEFPLKGIVIRFRGNDDKDSIFCLSGYWWFSWGVRVIREIWEDRGNIGRIKEIKGG